MKRLCFSPRTESFYISRQSVTSSSSTPRRRFSQSTIEQTIAAAATIIMKRDAGTSAHDGVTSLFHESKTEAMQFIKLVKQLQEIMHFLVSYGDSGTENIIKAQNLTEIAMKRLQKEFVANFLSELFLQTVISSESSSKSSSTSSYHRRRMLSRLRE